MTEEEFWTVLKGGIARYVLGIQTGLNPLILLMSISYWVDSLMPHIMEKEGIEDKISLGTTLKWLLEAANLSGSTMLQEERILHIEAIHEILAEENDLSPELKQAMNEFCGENDLSLFEDFLEDLND